MTYQDQLFTPEWKNKRNSIIERDERKCQNCFNRHYQKDFKSGLVLSNEILNNVPNTILFNNKDLIRIWNLQDNIIETTFIEKIAKFDTSKSYVIYYDRQNNYSKIYALKLIDNKKIVLEDLIDMTTIGVRGRVTETTFDEVYRPNNEDDIWELTTGLHVHHKYYQEGLMPWEYPDETLITLCWECHQKLH